VHHEDVWGSKVISTYSLNLAAAETYVVNFLCRRFFPPHRAPDIYLEGVKGAQPVSAVW